MSKGVQGRNEVLPTIFYDPDLTNSTAPIPSNGRIYTQFGQVGLASYHFDTPQKCFINWDTCPKEWTFDDGSWMGLPESGAGSGTAQFELPYFDLVTRTFTGIIMLPAPLDGNVRLKFRMVFSPSLDYIVDGEIVGSKKEFGDEWDMESAVRYASTVGSGQVAYRENKKKLSVLGLMLLPCSPRTKSPGRDDGRSCQCTIS